MGVLIMHLFRKFGLLAALASFILILGCSSGDTIVTPDNIMESTNNTRDFGLMGAYELSINPDYMTAELVSKRLSSIGESWIVNGISYFTIAPCQNCLTISGIDITPEGDLALVFSIRHPFEPGDTYEPPTAANRLDLDVFDVAMVIAPGEGNVPTTFPTYLEKIYDGICVNPDGYTMDLSEVIEDTAAMPYFLVVDESEMDPVPSPTAWNKFAMGATNEFDVVFDLESGSTLSFDMYLTMGYGHSAVKPDRLVPKYYNPEFNRKAAWKVVATSPEGDATPELGNTWDTEDDTTEYFVKVEVYDWQTDATVSTETDFANADPSEVYASSEVSAVHVEVAGMASDRSTLTVDDGTGTGMPGSPLVYNVPIRNENLLAAGEYPGLVTVVDDRLVGNPDLDSRDYIIDCPDGASLENHMIPAFQTYQTFTATVVSVAVCTDQELLYTFDGCLGPDDGVFTCEGWSAENDWTPYGGGCGLPNGDGGVWPNGNFLWGCAPDEPIVGCNDIIDGYLSTGSDVDTCSQSSDNREDADYNVVSPELTLPPSSNGVIEFDYCSNMAVDGSFHMWISLNGCTGPWTEIMTPVTASECSSTSVDISSYEGTNVIFRFQYTAATAVDVAGSGLCGDNAGLLIDNISINGCFYGDLLEN
jgi:hypothetical protein